MKNRDIKKLFKWKIWKKGTACLLVFSVLLQTVTVSAQGIAKGPPIDMQLIQQLQEAKMPMQSDVSEEGQIVQSSGEQSELTENGQTDQPSGDQSGSAENGQAVQPSGDQSGSAENGQTDPSSDQQSEDADLYENGIIKIYNIEQLQAIGTGSSVRMNDTEKELFGTGEEVVDGGNAVTYASDADYMLMNEIPLTAKTMWTLPEGFTGTFAEAPKEDAPLYDKESDTVYVYNNYQLLLIASENSAEEPIMSYDMIPEKVGIGQLLYKDGTLADESAEAAQEYLTYSKEHNYVLSPSFTEQMPELKAEKIKKEATVQADAGQLGGREYLGQVYTKVEGEPYILIGNEWQLRAIGQDAKPKEKGNQYMQVTPMLYVKSIVDLPWPWDDKITYTPYYPGDADFNLKQGEALGESGIEQKDFIYFSEANTNKTEGLMNIEYDKEGLVQSSLVSVDDVDVTVNLKGQAPSIDKTANATTVEIGQVVTYTIKGTIPDTTGYDKYTYKIHDTLTEGLDFVKDAVGTAQEGTSYNVSVKIGEGQAETKAATLSGENNRIMTLDLSEWIRNNQNSKGQGFTVTYYAKVNADAVVQTNNSAHLEYGNDPENTTTTTSDEVVTPTYPLDVRKTDTKETLLAGAVFRLYKNETDANAANEKAIKVTGSDGSYVVDPTSSNMDMTTKATDDSKGYNLHLNGLAAGDYWLVETQAPDGYNKLTAPVKVTITKTGDTEWKISKDGDNEEDKIIDIKNSSGTLLPETGGMGTVIFTVIAVVMILGIAVSFVISRRKRA